MVSPFLCPSRPGAAECTSCRNVKRWAFRTWDAHALQEKNANDEVFHVKYSLIVFTYEDRSRDPKTASRRDDLPNTLGVVTKMQVENYVSIEGEEMLGVLWPVDVYRMHEGREPPKDRADIMGSGVQNVILDPLDGITSAQWTPVMTSRVS